LGIPFEVTVAFGDCDEAGIVFYPNYLYWMDSAFQALLRSRSLNQRTIRSRFGALGTPIVECGARFVAPLRYDQLLQIDVSIETWRQRSFQVRFIGTSGGAAVFDGFEARVWAVPGENGQMQTGPIPASFKELLS
jgi:4-hydroxybenzoyl-CoA thioesterase